MLAIIFSSTVQRVVPFPPSTLSATDNQPRASNGERPKNVERTVREKKRKILDVTSKSQHSRLDIASAVTERHEHTQHVAMASSRANRSASVLFTALDFAQHKIVIRRTESKVQRCLSAMKLLHLTSLVTASVRTGSRSNIRHATTIPLRVRRRAQLVQRDGPPL